MVNAGLSPNVLATRAGISGNTVRDAQFGRGIPTRHTRKAIADVLGVTPLEIWPIEVEQR